MKVWEGSINRVKNPFDKGYKENMLLFWKAYPSMRSHLNNTKILNNDEEQFYQHLLSDYGELYVRQLDKPFKDDAFSFSDSDEEEKKDNQVSFLFSE